MFILNMLLTAYLKTNLSISSFKHQLTRVYAKQVQPALSFPIWKVENDTQPIFQRSAKGIIYQSKNIILALLDEEVGDARENSHLSSVFFFLLYELFTQNSTWWLAKLTRS